MDNINIAALKTAMRGVPDEETSFQRVLRLAEQTRQTHYVRRAQRVQQFADGEHLPPRGESTRVVYVGERTTPDWWRDRTLWENSHQHRSAVEFEALHNIQQEIGLDPVKPRRALDLARYEGTAFVSEAWAELRGNLPLREILARRRVTLHYVELADGSLMVLEQSIAA